MSDFEKASLRRARLPHHCIECRAVVDPAQKYYQLSGCWDGDFYCTKICSSCYEFRKLYFEAMNTNDAILPDEVAYTHGSLIEEAAEYLQMKSFGADFVPRQGWLASERDQMSPLLVAHIAAEERWRREEHLRNKDSRRRHLIRVQHSRASRRMVEGLSESARLGPLRQSAGAGFTQAT